MRGITHHTFLLGFPMDRYWASIKLFFWRRCRGEEALLQGESLVLNLFTLLVCFSVSDAVCKTGRVNHERSLFQRKSFNLSLTKLAPASFLLLFHS